MLALRHVYELCCLWIRSERLQLCYLRIPPRNTRTAVLHERRGIRPELLIHNAIMFRTATSRSTWQNWVVTVQASAVGLVNMRQVTNHIELYSLSLMFSLIASSWLPLALALVSSRSQYQDFSCSFSNSLSPIASLARADGTADSSVWLSAPAMWLPGATPDCWYKASNNRDGTDCHAARCQGLIVAMVVQSF